MEKVSQSCTKYLVLLYAFASMRCLTMSFTDAGSFKCSKAARAVVDSVCGKHGEEVALERIDDAFTGATRIHFQEPGAGHHLSILHMQGRHRLIQCNALSIRGNHPFSVEAFLQDKVPVQQGKQELVRIIFQEMSTAEFKEWLGLVNQVEVNCQCTAKKVFSLTGVYVNAQQITTTTFMAK